jgi:ferredoxin--NADP+ reductase
MPPVAPLPGKVVGHRRWTDALYSLQVEADIAPFEAGQFGRIGLEVDGKPLMRPYSFVNAPAERPLEFYYILLSGGPLTGRLIKLRAGDDILINQKSNGFLVLSEVPDAKQLWMLATGTALGPFLSILKSEEVWRRFADIVLVHAVRFAKELSYGDSVTTLVEKGGGRLRFIPFVSREETSFDAMRGRIPAALQSGELQARAGLDVSPEKSQFMLCGNPQMVKDTTAVLQEMGFEKNRRRTPGHITIENYW